MSNLKVGSTPTQILGSEVAMWIIVRTRKQKNSFLNSDAVSYRDRLVSPRERRGVGVVRLEADHSR
jgi:hypothetical protein